MKLGQKRLLVAWFLNGYSTERLAREFHLTQQETEEVLRWFLRLRREERRRFIARERSGT